jgi:hypothetical protein
MVQGIPRSRSIREISTLQLKKSFRKGFQIYASHMEELGKDNEPSLEYYLMLKEYEDVFGELPGLPPKRDIDFSIELMSGASLVSKTPYRMSIMDLKELYMQVPTRIIVEEGVHMTECLTLG